MSQTERILFIDRKLRSQGSFTISQVCKEFEISSRQVKRDIEYMRDRFEAPIDWDFKEKDEDNPYTTAVNIPQYNIQGECPPFSEMYDNRKEKEMILDIENSDLSEEEKEFLIAAAHRHCRFNFTAIAEYYAHASKKKKKFMEDSALVIIDMDNAIMNGYVKLSKTIEELRNEE